jgi:arabinogalactan oligomer/maltooligosaccharide transport system permease protein
MSNSNFIQRFRSSRTQQKKMGIIIRWIIALILIAFAIFPVLWVFSASISPTGTLSTQKLIPENANLDNYKDLLTNEVFPFTTWFLNSLKIASIVTILSVSITTLAAYSFSRFRFRQRQNMLRGILLIQVFPGILAIVAVFLLIAQIGRQIPAFGLNTHSGLILVYLGGAMGINIWLMKGFFDSIPRAIDESAMVDGASHWQIFSRLLLPLMRPIIVVISILTFIFVYSDFVMARVLLTNPQQQTLMVGLFIFTSNQFASNWGLFAAGALIGALPIMIVYILLQDQIVGGLTQGSVKG